MPPHLVITRLGLGAWAIGGGEWAGGWGPQDDADSVAAIHHAVEVGIGWIDTAPAYGFGRAEEVVGRALAQLRPDERPLVFTKCGLVWEPGEMTGFSNVLAPESIRRECDASLRRLGVERIDLLQIHWPSEDGTPIEESWATMAALVDEGKVGAIGVSNVDVALLDACERIHPVGTVQPPLNLLEREAGAEVIPWCEAHGTGVIVYSPMRSGLLSGRFSAERAAALPEDDWRAAHPDFQPPGLDRNLELVERLRPLAEDAGATVARLAIAWALAWPGVTGAIVGARTPEQVDGWIGAADVTVDAGLRAEVERAIEETGAGTGPIRPTAVRPAGGGS
jgi:aryl-alcohol dehydrogenase-like predicted oxidoreductase